MKLTKTIRKTLAMGGLIGLLTTPTFAGKLELSPETVNYIKKNSAYKIGFENGILYQMPDVEITMSHNCTEKDVKIRFLDLYYTENKNAGYGFGFYASVLNSEDEGLIIGSVNGNTKIIAPRFLPKSMNCLLDKDKLYLDILNALNENFKK